MNLFTNDDIKKFFIYLAGILGVFIIILQLLIWISFGRLSLTILFISLLTAVAILIVCYRYFYNQHRIMENAILKINSYLSGNTEVRIECDSEGELFKLFHAVNTLATVLNSHAENEQRVKVFLKNTISDISHQLKTPLAALNIYNEILQDEVQDLDAIQKFAKLSEQELDRIDILVKSLLKITKLDAGSIIIEKSAENIGDMMQELKKHFEYRAKKEQKTISLIGMDSTTLFCDKNWLIEAISNIVKNALDHTDVNNHISIKWKQLSNITQIIVEDDGCGIHPEDIHHIFKRFYRSRYSKDTQGIGLGLPLAKAIVNAHDGNITVDSIRDEGSVFILNFPNPTKL